MLKNIFRSRKKTKSSSTCSTPAKSDEKFRPLSISRDQFKQPDFPVKHRQNDNDGDSSEAESLKYGITATRSNKFLRVSVSLDNIPREEVNNEVIEMSSNTRVNQNRTCTKKPISHCHESKSSVNSDSSFSKLPPSGFQTSSSAFKKKLWLSKKSGRMRTTSDTNTSGLFDQINIHSLNAKKMQPDKRLSNSSSTVSESSSVDQKIMYKVKVDQSSLVASRVPPSSRQVYEESKSPPLPVFQTADVRLTATSADQNKYSTMSVPLEECNHQFDGLKPTPLPRKQHQIKGQNHFFSTSSVPAENFCEIYSSRSMSDLMATDRTITDEMEDFITPTESNIYGDSYDKTTNMLPRSSTLKKNELDCGIKFGGSDDTEADESIPILVEVSPKMTNAIPAANDLENVFREGSDNTVETGPSAGLNESDLYMLSDSFLDNTSFGNCSVLSRISSRPLDNDVMVVDDYQPAARLKFSAVLNQEPESPDSVDMEEYFRPVLSQRWISNTFPGLSYAGCSALGLLVKNWTSDDVQSWLHYAGLGRFSDAFKCKIAT